MRRAPRSRRAGRFVEVRDVIAGEDKMQGSRPGVKPFVEAMARREVACRGVRRANAGAAGIKRRQFFAPEGDSDVPSGFAKNGDAHVNFWTVRVAKDLN